MAATRNRIDIKREQLEALAEIGTSLTNIAHVFGCTPDTITRRFPDIAAKYFPRGRPSLKLSEDEIFNLAKKGCTNEEISQRLGCSPDTLTRNFADILKKGRAEMAISIRSKQFEIAEQGDRTLLIWLGKQVLGQKNEPAPTSGGDRLKELTAQFRERNELLKKADSEKKVNGCGDAVVGCFESLGDG